MFRLGYNTNGLAHHRLEDALPLLAELGYEAVAITPDIGQLDPFRLDSGEVRKVKRLSEQLGLALAIETGARYVLDPRRKHYPTLMDPEPAAREVRRRFLERCVDLAHELGAGLVSIWSGRAEGAAAGAGDQHSGADGAWERLVGGLRPLLDYAAERGLRIGFEPEPGMFIERPMGYLALLERLGETAQPLGLTLDVGHLLVTGDLPVGEMIGRLAPHLVGVHLDDIAGGIHEHLQFGSGDLDLRETLTALHKVGYAGIAAVELSRDSHQGVDAARVAMDHLRSAMQAGS